MWTKYCDRRYISNPAVKQCGSVSLTNCNNLLFRYRYYRITLFMYVYTYINPLTPNDHFRGRTATLTSKLCILYIYLTNTGTEYFKHSMYSPFLPLQNAVCFIILTYLVPVLFTFYIQGVLN